MEQFGISFDESTGIVTKITRVNRHGEGNHDAYIPADMVNGFECIGQTTETLQNIVSPTEVPQPFISHDLDLAVLEGTNGLIRLVDTEHDKTRAALANVVNEILEKSQRKMTANEIREVIITWVFANAQDIFVRNNRFTVEAREHIIAEIILRAEEFGDRIEDVINAVASFHLQPSEYKAV